MRTKRVRAMKSVHVTRNRGTNTYLRTSYGGMLPDWIALDSADASRMGLWSALPVIQQDTVDPFNSPGRPLGPRILHGNRLNPNLIP